MWIGIGVVVVVVVLVLALALAGILPIFSSGSSSPSVMTYDQALPLANGAAQGVAGGNWVLILSIGLASPVSASGTNSLSGGSGCTVTPVSGSPSNISLLPGPSNLTSGSSPNWMFLYRNAGGEMLIVGVLGGKAAAYDTIASGQTCSELFGFFYEVPSNVIDSSAAANAVSADAASFLAANPNVTASYGLFGGGSVLGFGKVGAEWLVNYTTCPVTPASGATGTAFNATVNATTGAVIAHQVLPKVTCTSESAFGLVRETARPAPLGRPVGVGVAARKN